MNEKVETPFQIYISNTENGIGTKQVSTSRKRQVTSPTRGDVMCGGEL